ncbi:MAG: hypothetical protein K8S23_03735 [Candidatus Cloacimonetes bacterium]|nr:hypothetical protein [Candidatus Cloacimonadota bacterium]
MNIGIIKKNSLFLIIFLIALFGCTQKKNHTGIPDSNLKIYECDISSEHLTRFYSYEDSLKNANLTKLVLGNFENIEAVSLIKFLDMPDSVDTIEDITNVKLTLQIDDRLNFETVDNQSLKIGKIIDNKWFESDVTWLTLSDSTEWNEGSGFSESAYELLEDLEIEETTEDTISITLSNQLIFDWIEADSTNYGIAIFSEQENSFIELYSTETANYSVLEFDFLGAEADTSVHYTSANSSAYDAFIYHKTDGDELQYYDDKLLVKNVFPTKMFLKFDITDELFIDSESTGITFLNSDISGIQDSTDFHRTRVNKATLILHRIEENSYSLAGNYSLKPYLAIDENIDIDNPETPFVYSEDYISYGDASYGEIDSDSLFTSQIEIDVTDIVQTMFSGSYDSLGDTNTYENYGMIIKSIYENYDFLLIDFYTNDESVDEVLRPKLKIIYTPPYNEQ